MVWCFCELWYSVFQISKQQSNRHINCLDITVIISMFISGFIPRRSKPITHATRCGPIDDSLSINQNHLVQVGSWINPKWHQMWRVLLLDDIGNSPCTISQPTPNTFIYIENLNPCRGRNALKIANRKLPVDDTHYNLTVLILGTCVLLVIT